METKEEMVDRVIDKVKSLKRRLPSLSAHVAESADAFAALLETLEEVAGDGVHPGVFTEVFWAALHGLATLTRAGRLPPEYAERRMELLVDRLAVL